MSLLNQGKNVEAEPVLRKQYEALVRDLGSEHRCALSYATSLARCLSSQDKNAEAELIWREVLAVKRRTLGAEHEETLVAASNLASTLSRHGEHSLDLDRSLSGHDKYAEAQEIQRETLRLCKRVLGAEHPGTLKAANNLATTLSRQGRHAKAKKILQAAVATCERVLGPTHLTTLQYVSNLESVLAWAQIRAKLPTKAAAPVAAGSARPLAAGTRVIVQRLVTKSEHNSQRARVLAFDARSERYVVVLDNGKELSLKPECVASAQCARCASEEASSVCARCQAVRYCSRDCQRADWKVHKPACTADAAVS